MQGAGVNRISRSLVAATGLLLLLVTVAAGADPLDAEDATLAASQPMLADVVVTDVDAARSSSASASKESANTGDNPVGPFGDEGAFLGQLVMQYFESYN